MKKDDQDAKFLGLQQNAKGKPQIPLFRVMKRGHRLERSTVSERTLRENGLRVPEFENKEDWQQRAVVIEEMRIRHWQQSRKYYQTTYRDVIAWYKFLREHEGESFNDFMTGQRKGKRKKKIEIRGYF